MLFTYLYCLKIEYISLNFFLEYLTYSVVEPASAYRTHVWAKDLYRPLVGQPKGHIAGIPTFDAVQRLRRLPVNLAR